ncbi:LysR family transcriptional regulator [Marinomonas rhizomae]|uniref:DNA-binding transcriptional LysR family regulator n=1 Tax=Marinomonas rhizomae TaxID=491948 RepID=A0A366J9V0_9GAMM|nr:LysR family transcriptional regulator [Marinomonas rhizomae]RBP83791.1 DNA-binding transcriptional LysR family regulator [Marinomonas rhizomae]RNF73497.1 LysR family transcriptional regulator [Marinomonas rhizomae]
MNFDQLKTFLWVAKLGGVRRAAQQMNLSQPAVSARISALEEELGIKLFDRQKSGVVLTKEGLLLRSHAERVESYLSQIRAELTPSEEVKGTLRIGVAETIAQSWLSEFLSALRKHYPKLVVELSVDISMNLRDQLLSRNMDLVFLMGPLSEGNVENITLPSFELGWFCHPQTENKDLGSTPIISFSRLSRPYQELMSELMRRYREVGQVFPSTSLSTSFEMIASGIGVGVLPIQLAQRFIEANRLISFDPGWVPEDLIFTASYLNDPRDHTVYQVAQLALQIAKEYDKKTKPQKSEERNKSF